MSERDDACLTTLEAMAFLKIKSRTSFRKFYRKNYPTVKKLNLTEPGKEGPGCHYHYMKSDLIAAAQKSGLVY